MHRKAFGPDRLQMGTFRTGPLNVIPSITQLPHQRQQELPESKIHVGNLKYLHNYETAYSGMRSSNQVML